MADATLTEQQAKWMASVRASLETSTGRTLTQWVEVARGCPETAPRARQKWLKDNHGLGQNYAAMVLSDLARANGEAPRDPKALGAALWSTPEAAAVFAALQVAVADLPDLVTGQRKTYTTWSRAYAFASARPARAGTVRLGLAVEPAASPRLEPAHNEGWSDRLKATLVLTRPDQVDDEVRVLLRTAWDRG